MATSETFLLTASTNSSVTVSAPDDIVTTFEGIYGNEEHRIHQYLNKVTVVNHDSSESVAYRFDGSVPTEGGGSGDYFLGPGQSYEHSPVRWDEQEFVLISSGGPSVTIMAD